MWDILIKLETEKPYYKNLLKLIDDARENNIVYPEVNDVFNAFKLTPFEQIKVVIIGQDPYHQKGQAHGLAFSTLDSKTPKSLINIKKELLDDLGLALTSNNDLSSWSEQGVLLLNTLLTVNESKPLSHKDFGWEIFTLNLFKAITTINKPIVFILWGNHAKSFEKYISNEKHLIIKSAHPSPLSSYRGFFGSKPFSKTNNFLISNKLLPINFKI